MGREQHGFAGAERAVRDVRNSSYFTEILDAIGAHDVEYVTL